MKDGEIGNNERKNIHNNHYHFHIFIKQFA